MTSSFWLILISGLAALGFSLLIVFSERFHWKITHDHDLVGVQKFHKVPVPRIGGVALLVGLVCGGIYHGLASDYQLNLAKWAGVAMIPVFLGGLLEDLGRGMSPRERLLLAFFSATIAHYELNVGLDRIGWGWFDSDIIPIPGVSLLLTVLMVGGVSHATNIIDGFNGLLLGVAMLALGSFIWVADQVEAGALSLYMAIMLGAMAGVFFINFPYGRIFLGDGGAYLIGFLLSILALLLVRVNQAVSPWFPLVVLAYPITETVFSMFRKKVLYNSPAMSPDRYHYHMLVYSWLGRRMRKIDGTIQNALTSIVMWLVCLLGCVPALYWWRDTPKLIISLSVFICCYLISYSWLKKNNDAEQKM